MFSTLYLKFYRDILRVRAFESFLIDGAKKRKFRQPICSSIGQEAGGVVIAALLERGDWLIPPSHRAFSYIVSRGAPLKLILSEMMGKKNGIHGGIAGDRFIFPKLGIAIYSNSMGANFSLALGLALAVKRKKEKKIVVCVFGDGAASRGTFHGALNISALWRLPILWVCQNNQFSISARFSNICAVRNIADRARGYNIDGIIADGNNVLEIYEKSKNACDSIRKNCYPVLIELKTYRVSSHYVGEGHCHLYQKKQEIVFWKKRDPLLILEKELKKAGIFSQNLKNQIKIEIEKELQFLKA